MPWNYNARQQRRATRRGLALKMIVKKSKKEQCLQLLLLLASRNLPLVERNQALLLLVAAARGALRSTLGCPSALCAEPVLLDSSESGMRKTIPPGETLGV